MPQTANLLDYQKPIADRVEASLLAHRFHVLATCTGSGKSYISADVMRRLQKPTLVICPKAAVTQTRRCIESMGASDLLLDVINPAKLVVSDKCGWYSPKTLWHIPKGSLICWDEIHRGCSGIDSKATLACAELKAFGATLLAMSATAACDPLHMRALSYWGGLSGFSPPEYLCWCKNNGCARVEMNGRNVMKFTRNKARAVEIMKGIRAGFGDMFQSLGPEDIEGFPAEVLEVLFVDLSARDRKEIDDAYADMSRRLKTKGKSDRAEAMRDRERIEFTMAAALAERALRDIEDGLSPVVFFNFTSPRERFEGMLRAGGIPAVASIYGGQNDSDRQRLIDAFQANEIHVASINVSAGGVALSLHDLAHERQRVSYLVPSYNAAEVKQALGRIRRVGGTSVVQRFVIAAGTRMELVAARLSVKLACIDSLNDNDLEP
jgi:hypothetical protein